MSVDVPPEVAELTSMSAEFVARSLGMVLDFTPESLAIVDHYATTVRQELEHNPTLGALVAPALGAYFGEVIRARMDGFWRMPSPNQHDWSLCSRLVFLAINPIGVAYGAVYRGDEHAGPGSALRVAPEDREYLTRRLETLPPVAEHEYFSFTTRFEVLEVAIEALCAKMEEDGYGGTRYAEEDYALYY